ncbi:DUF3237 family protein [Vibrio palustris]|uniref:DUF3237 family protein n=1 Tax=Vibrio palustris TaxID=1918946 RepID=UPI000986A7EF
MQLLYFLASPPNDDIYFHTTPTLEIDSGRLRWLKEPLFVCSASRTQTGVFIDVYLVK